MKRLSEDEDGIAAAVNRAFENDYLLEHRVENRGHWEEIAPIIARAAEDERDRQWIEWGDESCPHMRDFLKRDCDDCWQALKQEGEK